MSDYGPRATIEPRVEIHHAKPDERCPVCGGEVEERRYPIEQKVSKALRRDGNKRNRRGYEGRVFVRKRSCMTWGENCWSNQIRERGE